MSVKRTFFLNLPRSLTDDDDQEEDHAQGNDNAPLHVLHPHLTTDTRCSLSELDSTHLEISYELRRPDKRREVRVVCQVRPCFYRMTMILKLFFNPFVSSLSNSPANKGNGSLLGPSYRCPRAFTLLRHCCLLLMVRVGLVLKLICLRLAWAVVWTGSTPAPIS